jgi:phosphohistidine phosphatase SixA
MTNRTRTRLLLALLLIVPAGLMAARGPAIGRTPVEPTLVFLVRHAEKGTEGADPELTAAGRERAVELARVLASAGVTHLFSTELARARQTLQPLAEELGLAVTTIGARDGTSQLEALRGLPAGSVAVVAGHSNTIPAFVQALGGAVSVLRESVHGPVLGEDEYDRLFLVVLPPSEAQAAVAVRSVELRYGD